MDVLKHPRGMSSSHDEAMGWAKPLTPRSELPRSSWGSLAVSLQTVRGLCAKPKCFRKEGHEGDCYPR